MALPFLLTFLALLAAWRGQRAISVGLWALSVVVLLILFRLHATDPLDIYL